MTQEIEILQFLHYNPEASRAEIGSALTNTPSPATLKRMIADGVAKGHIEVVGRGPATRYRLTPQAHVTMDDDIPVGYINQHGSGITPAGILRRNTHPFLQQ